MFYPCVPVIIVPMDLSITGVHTLGISLNLAYVHESETDIVHGAEVVVSEVLTPKSIKIIAIM